MAFGRNIFGAVVGLALTAGAATAPAAMAQGRWDWGGGRPDDPRPYSLVGPGVRFLLPELRDSRRGQAFVLRNFDFDHDGFITPGEARAANRAFVDAAGPDRGRFDWDRYGGPGPGIDRGPPGPPPPPPVRAYDGGWDRAGMRDYHFRQGQYGALLTLQDVLFQTGSAELRPGAQARLVPLAGYLRANPGVRLRIDGYTDSVGSAASNLTLSQNRARSVADALSAAGLNPGRFQLAGHGEAMPVASNSTAAGRQLNRRVEVTLVGRRASEFQ